MKFTDLIPGKIYYQNYPKLGKIHNYVFIFDKLINRGTQIDGSNYINIQDNRIYPNKKYVNYMKDSVIRLATTEEIQLLCKHHNLDPTQYLTPSYEIY